MRDPVPRAFEIDLRSLAALRIGLGALLLADLAWRALDLPAHYGDAGVLPTVALRTLFADAAGLWSLHALSGAASFQAALFALAAAAALALLLGYRTRPAALLSWLLLLSLHHRNPLVLTGADQVLRLLLFWSLFLPLDAHWALQRRPRGASSERSPASAALLLQVAGVYLFSLVFKLRAEEWRGLTAVADTFAVEGVATAWARALTGFPTLLAVAAALTLLLEALAVVLPFLPWRRAQLRTVTALALAGLHGLAIAPALRLGLLPAVMALAWVPFLPGRFWERLGRGSGGPPIPEPSPAPRRRATDAVVLAALALVVVENVASLWVVPGGPVLPKPLRAAVEGLGLAQQWKLWDRPLPNRYYVFAATLADGSRVDLHTGGALDWDAPRRRSASHRWWKLQLHLARPYAAALRPWYARFLAARWDRDAPEDRRVVHLALVRIRADATAPRPGRLPRDVLWSGVPPR